MIYGAMLFRCADPEHILKRLKGKMLTWKYTRRSYMIYGHIHADTSADFWPLFRCRDHVLNAGVDVNGYRPVTFDELVENNRQF